MSLAGEEIWKDIEMEQFKGLYEISSKGRVKTKAHSFYKNGELVHANGRLLAHYDKSVFLTNGLYRGLWRIGVLFNATFPNKNK